MNCNMTSLLFWWCFTEYKSIISIVIKLCNIHIFCIYFLNVSEDQALCFQENLPLNALQQIMQNKCKLNIIQHILSWPFREHISCIEINSLLFLIQCKNSDNITYQVPHAYLKRLIFFSFILFLFLLIFSCNLCFQ